VSHFIYKKRKIHQTFSKIWRINFSEGGKKSCRRKRQKGFLHAKKHCLQWVSMSLCFLQWFKFFALTFNILKLDITKIIQHVSRNALHRLYQGLLRQYAGRFLQPDHCPVVQMEKKCPSDEISSIKIRITKKECISLENYETDLFSNHAIFFVFTFKIFLSFYMTEYKSLIRYWYFILYLLICDLIRLCFEKVSRILDVFHFFKSEQERTMLFWIFGSVDQYRKFHFTRKFVYNSNLNPKN